MGDNTATHSSWGTFARGGRPAKYMQLRRKATLIKTQHMSNYRDMCTTKNEGDAATAVVAKYYFKYPT